MGKERCQHRRVVGVEVAPEGHHGESCGLREPMPPTTSLEFLCSCSTERGGPGYRLWEVEKGSVGEVLGIVKHTSRVFWNNLNVQIMPFIDRPLALVSENKVTGKIMG